MIVDDIMNISVEVRKREKLKREVIGYFGLVWLRKINFSTFQGLVELLGCGNPIFTVHSELSVGNYLELTKLTRDDNAINYSTMCQQDWEFQLAN